MGRYPVTVLVDIEHEDYERPEEFREESTV
jgi:hypothetical protein